MAAATITDKSILVPLLATDTDPLVEVILPIAPNAARAPVAVLDDVPPFAIGKIPLT